MSTTTSEPQQAPEETAHDNPVEDMNLGDSTFEEPAKEDSEEYQMVEHPAPDYTDYDMAEDPQPEYQTGETDAGSILATQDHPTPSEQLMEEDGEHHEAVVAAAAAAAEAAEAAGYVYGEQSQAPPDTVYQEEHVYEEYPNESPAETSLAALSRAITNNPEEGETPSTPIQTESEGLTTPRSKRPRSEGSKNRLKSKVWNWYDIQADGFRQCRYCVKKYGRLTATTILARHYHTYHDPNPPPGTATPSRRGRRKTGGMRDYGFQQPTVYSQAAAAAVVAAAAATNEGYQDHDGNGQYEGENPLLLQDGFSSMMSTAPLERAAGRTLAAVAQFCAHASIEENLQTCLHLIEAASQRGARMIFLPEASDFISDNQQQPATQLAQPLDGHFMKEIQNAAKQHSIWVSVGIHEQQQSEESEQPVLLPPFNTNALVNDEGTLVSIYRKLHLFDVQAKEGPRMQESQATARGDRVADVIETPVGRLGTAICYDLRFPELAQLLRCRGAQGLCYPSAFTPSTGSAHWETLLRARAIETQCYVFGAAQIGKHNGKRTSHGDAMVVDPWGTVVARCSRNQGEPALALAEVDLEYLERIRREMPVFGHKRTDVFTEYA